MTIQEKIVEHLKEKYQPDAVILHGSRARKKNRPTSDWDIYLATRREGLSRTSETFEGQMLDINVIHLPLKTEEWADVFGSSLEVAEVLHDSDGVGGEIMQAAKAIYAQGRSLTSEEYQNKKNYLDRLLLRLEGYVTVPGIFFYYVGFFYEDAIRFWFELRDTWSKPVYETLSIIQTEDTEYFSQLEMLFGQGASEEKLRAARMIRAKLFSEK